MVKHLTPLDSIEWVSVIALQLYILKQSWKRYKTLVIAMVYLLIESLILVIGKVVGEQCYSKSYYLLSVGECLLMALVSVELSMKIVPKAKRLIKTLGPLVTAIPIFCIGVVLFPFKITLIEFMTNVLRVSQVAFILSLGLLFISFAFEDEPIKETTLARCYAALLAMLIVCAEAQLHFNVIGLKVKDISLATQLVRAAWPIAWIVGLGLVGLSLKRKTGDT